MLKRVLALPGDIIRTRINSEVIIPEGHCWLEGDNADNSVDSNEFGPGIYIKSRLTFQP